MKIEDLKVGDEITKHYKWYVTVRLISENEIVVEYQDDSSYSVVDKLKLEEYELKPKTRKLYAYRTNYDVCEGPNAIEWFEDANIKERCDCCSYDRTPQYDKEYKE